MRNTRLVLTLLATAAVTTSPVKADQPVYAIREYPQITIATINAETKRIGVELPNGGSQDLGIGPKTWIIKDGGEASFADLRVGQRLRVRYIPRSAQAVTLEVLPSEVKATLKKSIGIKTAGDVFTPLVKADQRLPHTYSQTFTNKTDAGPSVVVVLSQKDETGIETIASLPISIPRVPDNTLNIIVTLKISEDKQLRVKTTVAETASVQEFGPFPLE
jgi:hypothetical protein